MQHLHARNLLRTCFPSSPNRSICGDADFARGAGYTYCTQSPKCQKAHNEFHAPVCYAGNEGRQGAAWGVSFQDEAFNGRYGLKAKPCLSSPQVRGWVCPATELIGLPLYIAPEDNMDYATKKDLESICHYLMMDPDTGFALDR